MMHALVIGGSGMLAGVCLWLAREGHRVTVIGRDRRKLDRLSGQNSRISGVSADYSQSAAFSETLNELMKQRGPAGLVVAWMHHSEERVIAQTADAIRLAGGADFKCICTMSSAAVPIWMKSFVRFRCRRAAATIRSSSDSSSRETGPGG